MLLGCNTEPSRKSLTSKGVAVPSDSFEAEFPNGGRDAGSTLTPTDEGEPTVGSGTAASSETAASGASLSSAASESTHVSTTAIEEGSTVDVASSLGATDSTVQSAVGPAVMVQLLAVDLACGAKPSDAANYLCVNTDCVDGIDVADSWVVPGDATGSYDIDVELAGNVETFSHVSGETVGSNEHMMVIATAAPDPGDLNVYELVVGDVNYVLNASAYDGEMYAVDEISFSLGAVSGGTPITLRARSNDCNQVSICTIQGECTNDPVPDDGQHLQVTMTAASL